MQRIKTFIHDHPHIWWGLFLPVYLGIFFTIEHFITDNYWSMRSMTAAPSASTPTMFRPAPKSYITSSARKLTSRMSKQVRMACWDSSLIPRNSGDAPISIAFTPPFSGGGPAACL